MRYPFHPVALLTALALLPALAAQADTDPHAISPDMIQDQQRAVQREQQRVEQEAGGEALAQKRGQLIHDCQTRVGQKSLYPGRVSFESVDIIEEKRVYITGRVDFPDAQGKPERRHYECMLDKAKEEIETISVKMAAS